MRVNRAELLGAGALAALGVALALLALRYPLGSLLRPGPGFVPLGAGLGLVLFGGIVALEARRSQLPRPAPQWRALFAVVVGMALFAALAPVAGLVPATFALVFVAGLGERRPRPGQLAAVAVAISALGAVLFLWGLGVPLSVIGPR